MFDRKVNLTEFILGLGLATLILYLFWKWIENGYHQWDTWDRSNLSPEDKQNKENRVKWFLTPNRWLADSYQPVMFWQEFYSAKYF